MTRNALLTFCICTSIVSLGCKSPKERGRAEAERDLKKGILCLKSYGYPGEVSRTYYQLAKERYGIQNEVVAGCMVTTELTEHADAYNEVMREAITEKFGQDALSKINKEAWEIYEKKGKVEGNLSQ
jgi:hypothetical protein